MDTKAHLIPDGFEEFESHAPYAAEHGPYYEKQIDEGTVVRAFRVEEKHLNSLGYVHGGMYMTFADSSLARAIFVKHNRRGVTLKMNSEFLAPAKKGDWVEAHTEVIRSTRSVAFVRGELKVGNRVVFRMDGLFHYIKADVTKGL
ncbi:PaaI family thioesterase [Sneathiella chinensis]|nr:PaaI family thioesterase [Sneathiella chinensis]